MAEGIPPWLDFSPATFVGAAEAGQRLRQDQKQEQDQVGLERARLAQSAVQAAAELGLRSQQLQDSQKETALQHQIQMEQLQNQFLRQQTSAAATKAYRDAQIGLAQNRLDMEGQKLTSAANDKAMDLADRQNYAMAIASGMSPAEALAKYPRALASAAALGRGASDTQTVTEHFKEQPAIPAESTPGQPANPGVPIWPAFGVAGVIAKLRGGGNFGEQDAIPAVNTPGTPGHPAYTVSRKIPAGTPAEYALNSPGSTNMVSSPLPVPPENVSRVGDNQVIQPGDTNAPASKPTLKFIRDKDGNLVLADDQSTAQ